MAKPLSSKEFRWLAQGSQLDNERAASYLDSLRGAQAALSSSLEESLVLFRGQLCAKLNNWHPKETFFVDSRLPLDSNLCALFQGLVQDERHLLWVASAKPRFLSAAIPFVASADSRILDEYGSLDLEVPPRFAVVTDVSALIFLPYLDSLRRKLPPDCVLVTLSEHHLLPADLKFKPDLVTLAVKSTTKTENMASRGAAGAVVGAAAGTAAFSAAPTLILGGINMAGFTSTGVAAGSLAAAVQTPATVAGSAFAICQSAGATGSLAGLGALGTVCLPLVITSVAVVSTATLVVLAVRRAQKGRKVCPVDPSLLGLACVFCQAPVNCLLSCDHHVFCTDCMARTQDKCVLCWKS